MLPASGLFCTCCNVEEATAAVVPDREFRLVVGEPAEFRFLSSTIRKQDHVGDLLENWGGKIEELSPLEVMLTLEGQKGNVLPVRLESRVTEIGTLELWCASREGTNRWKLELNIPEKSEP